MKKNVFWFRFPPLASVHSLNSMLQYLEQCKHNCQTLVPLKSFIASWTFILFYSLYQTYNYRFHFPAPFSGLGDFGRLCFNKSRWYEVSPWYFSEVPRLGLARFGLPTLRSGWSLEPVSFFLSPRLSVESDTVNEGPPGERRGVLLLFGVLVGVCVGVLTGVVWGEVPRGLRCLGLRVW